MSERFTKWCPAEVSGETASLVFLHDDRHGLTIRVDVAGRTIEIAFGVVVAFRSAAEECCVDFWSRFQETESGVGPFWIVESSDFVAAFSEADLIHHPNPKHYLIVTDDDRIDVVATREPVVRLVTTQ